MCYTELRIEKAEALHPGGLFLFLHEFSRKKTYIMIRHPKRRGEWVELQFMARAAAQNLVVSKPWGDSARYDFIVDSRGHYSRVQVKSTSFKDCSAYLCNTISRPPQRNQPGIAYTPDDIDFFAFYIIPEEIWYIVPIDELRKARYAAYLNPYDPKNRYFPYLEAWHLLKDSRTAPAKSPKRLRRIHACAESALQPGLFSPASNLW